MPDRNFLLQQFGLTRFEKITPQSTVPNTWFEKFWKEHGVKMRDDFDIKSSTGIESRRYFPPSMEPAAIAAEMIQQLRRVIEKDGQQCLEFFLVSSDPAIEKIAAETSERVQMLGEGINWACTGFPGALQHVLSEFEGMPDDEVGQQLINQHILIVWMEVWRTLLNVYNHKVAPLFGDCCIGTGFTNILSHPQHLVRYRILDVLARRIGVEKKVIWLNEVRDGKERNVDYRDNTWHERPAVCPSGAPPGTTVIDMNGFEIFKVAPVKMVDVAVELLERNGLSPNHVHHFHCHRANARMKKIIAKELNRRDFEPVELAQESRPWEPSDITMDLSEGNSGGASLALGLHQCDDSFTSGDQIICTAVGGGRNLGNWEVPIGEDDVHRKETDEGELTCGAVLFEVV